MPALAALFLVSATAVADEGGVSFWLPGQMSSFAAVPGAPGWSLPLVYYHASEDARSKSRPEGWNVWLTLSLPLEAGK